MLALELLESWWAILAVPAALLIGASFAALGLSAVTLMRSWADFAFVELLTLPMFLFGDVRAARRVPPAPVDPAGDAALPRRRPDARPHARDVGWDELIHVAYLLGVMALGVWFTARRLERKLLK